MQPGPQGGGRAAWLPCRDCGFPRGEGRCTGGGVSRKVALFLFRLLLHYLSKLLLSRFGVRGPPLSWAGFCADGN